MRLPRALCPLQNFRASRWSTMMARIAPSTSRPSKNRPSSNRIFIAAK
jgi:hypothetical protein